MGEEVFLPEEHEPETKRDAQRREQDYDLYLVPGTDKVIKFKKSKGEVHDI